METCQTRSVGFRGRVIGAPLAADPCVVCHDERLDLLVQLDRVAARTQRVLAAIDTDPPPLLPGIAQRMRDKAFVREEVACWQRWSPGVAGARLHDAADLVQRLPAAVAGLEGRPVLVVARHGRAGGHRWAGSGRRGRGGAGGYYSTGQAAPVASRPGSRSAR